MTRTNPSTRPAFGATATAAAALLLAGPASAATFTGNGDGTTWEDAGNWNTAQFPGEAGFPANQQLDIDGISNGNRVVNLNSDIGSGYNDFRVDAKSNTGTTVLNLNAASSVVADGKADTYLSINEGDTNNAAASSTVNLSGDLQVGQLRFARDNGTATLNVLDGANLTVTHLGGNGVQMRNDKDLGEAVAILNVSGGTATFGSATAGKFLKMGTVDSRVLISGNAVFNGIGLTLDTQDASKVGSTDLIRVTGSDASITFKAARAWRDDANTTGSVTFDFVADAGGVSTVDILNLLDLDGNGSTDFAPDLTIDISAYTGSDDLVLFDYGSLDGTFANVTITGGSGTLDYNYMGNNQIALTAIPEPASFALLGLGGLVMVTRRRKA